MNMTQQILLGVVLPGVVSLVVMWIAWASSASEMDRRRRVWSGAVALGVAFIAAYILLLGYPGYPPAEAVKWLPWFALGGLVIGLLEGALRPPYLYLWLIRMAAAGALVWLLLDSLIRSSWTSDMGFHWVLWLGVAIILIWSTVDETAWRVRGWAVPLALTLAALALSLTLLWCGSAMYFQISLMLVAATGAAFLVALGRPYLTLFGGGTPVFIIVYYALLICGYFYAGIPNVNPEEFKIEQLCAPLLALAPALGGFALSGRLHRYPGKQAAAAFFWIVIPALLGAILAYTVSASSAAYF